MSEQAIRTIDTALNERRDDVARQIIAVDEALHAAFTYRRRRYLPDAIAPALLDIKQALDYCDFDHAEHLARVIQRMIAREAPKFAADPQRYIAKQKQLAEDRT